MSEAVIDQAELEEQEVAVVEKTEEELQTEHDEEYNKVFYGDEDAEEAVSDTPQEEAEEVEVSTDDVPEGEADIEVKPQEEVAEQPEEDSGTTTLKWNGQEVKVSKEELVNMAQQGFDSTYKYQQIAKSKKEHKAELDLLEKVKSGDKEALAQLSKQAGIDPIDILDIEVPDIEQGTQNQDEPFVSNEVSDLIREVEKDEALYTRMQDIEHHLPSSVVGVMAKDPQTFYSIVNEVRTGDADIVLPQVTAKLATLPDIDRALVTNNPDQFAQFYMGVKQSMIAEHQAKETKPKPEQKVKVNPAEVGIKRSGRDTTAGKDVGVDSFNSDSTYQDILNRLAQG